MKICYIAHPIGGNIEENLADLRRIIRRINLEYPDVVPFCPYYADVVSMNDHIQSERDRGMQNDFEIITRGVPDELWLTGTHVSSGMEAEKVLAETMDIPVINKIGQL